MHASVSMGFHTLPLSKPVFCIKLVYTLDYLSSTFVVFIYVRITLAVCFQIYLGELCTMLVLWVPS